MVVIITILAMLFVMALLWNISEEARYYLKYIGFGLISLTYASVPIPLMLLRPRDSRNALIPAYGLRSSCRFLGLKTKVTGQENIVKDGGCVVLINHQSFLDLIVLAELWPIMDNCTVISKKEIFYLQPFGLASWLWGTIFIDRVKPEKAQEALNNTGKIIRDRKARVLMFPEGTRNDKTTLKKFKKGAFHLAIAAKCPLQPVVVSRYNFLGKRKFDNGNILIKILPQVSTEGYSKENLDELIEKTYNIMSENVDLVSKEVENNFNNNKIKSS